MLPEIHVLGLSLKTFGILFALGFIAAGLVVARRLRELERPVDWAYEMLFAALAGGVIGARLYYVVQHWDQTRSDPIGTAFGGAGLVWYGGALGGALFVVLWAWRRRFLNLTLLDIAAPALAVGYAIGRIGCQVSGDGDYGRPSSLPWAMPYPHGTVPTDVPVHPTPIYETLAMGLAAWVLWRMRDRVRPGIVFAAYLVLQSVERFLVEFVRRNHEVLGPLTAAQIESLVLFAVGIGWLALVARRGGLRVGAGRSGRLAAGAAPGEPERTRIAAGT
jgi:phosphatidylglycerol:prolipoprotein diacylglycerol transferase